MLMVIINGVINDTIMCSQFNLALHFFVLKLKSLQSLM